MRGLGSVTLPLILVAVGNLKLNSRGKMAEHSQADPTDGAANLPAQMDTLP